jgi:hypothetical protein
MRLEHPDGTTVHLAYCTNVHPAEDLDGVLDQLRRFGEPVRAALGVARLGLGLWLADTAAAALAADPAAVDRLRRGLARRGLEVVTLNGFPYRGFHAPTVKQAVYHPDWTRPERLSYTLDLARILAALLPDDAVRGSVSTVPLGWRDPWGDDAHAAALDQLARLAEGLDAVAARAGRPVRVGWSRSPAAWWTPPSRPWTGCPASTAAGSASASTPATWPSASRTRWPPWRGSRRRGCRW